MRVRALDSNGDWTFGRGRNNYFQGRAARAQNIQTRLMSFLGDCFFALTDGIDWFGLLGAKNPLAVDFAIQTTIVTTDGVTGVSRGTFSLDSNRRLNTSYNVDLVNETGLALNVPVAVTTSRLLDELGDILTTEGGDPLSL